jgi:hypothetical protein
MASFSRARYHGVCAPGWAERRIVESLEYSNRCFLKQRREKQSGPANVRCFSVKLDDEFCTELIMQGMKVRARANSHDR